MLQRTCLLLITVCSLFSNVFAQKGDKVFRDDTIHVLKIDFVGNLDSTVSSNEGEPNRWVDTLVHWHLKYKGQQVDYRPYFQTVVTFDGKVIDSVGVCAKGAKSSFGSSQNNKYSLKLDFDRFKSEKGQTLNGLGKINLQNNTSDKSAIRQKLMYDMHHWLGLTAPRASFCRVYVNGQNLGLYTIVEHLDNKFLKMRFPQEGHLYKGWWVDFKYQPGQPDPNITFPDPNNPETYGWNLKPKNFEENHDFSDVIKIYDAVDGILGTPDSLNMGDTLRKYFEIEDYLKLFAADLMTYSWDNFYLGGGHNFYMYYDSTVSKFRMIPWDYDLSIDTYYAGLGNFNAIYDVVRLRYDKQGSTYFGAAKRDVNRLGVLHDEENLKKLMTHICHIQNEYIDNGVLEAAINRLQTLVRQEVYDDPVKAYSDEEFNSEGEKISLVVDSISAFMSRELAHFNFNCPDFIPLTGLSATESDIFMDKGEVVYYDLIVTPNNATYPSFYWSIENKDIASTKFYGRTKGKEYGKTYITIKSHDGSVEKRVNVTVRKEEVNGLEEKNKALELVLYPNPATHEFNISNVEELGIKEIQLWSEDGKLVISFDATNVSSFDLEGLDPGLYIVKAFGDAQEYSTKILRF